MMCVFRLQPTRETSTDQLSFSGERDLYLLVEARHRWGAAHQVCPVLPKRKVSGLRGALTSDLV